MRHQAVSVPRRDRVFFEVNFKNWRNGMLKDFKNKLSDLNDIIYFDDHQFLREKTRDTVRLQPYIDEAIELLGSSLFAVGLAISRVDYPCQLFKVSLFSGESSSPNRLTALPRIGGGCY